MKNFICLLFIAMQLFACTTDKSRSVTYRPPQDFANYNDFSGLKVGAEAFDDIKLAEEAFGFDIRAAGLLPVQVVINNRSGQVVEVIADQTFLIDDNNRYWKVLSNQEVVTRFQKATEGGTIEGGAAIGTAPVVSAGTLLGLTFAVVSGGGAGVAIVKGGKAGDDRQREMKTDVDIRDKGIDGRVLLEETLASGMVYFPGEVAFAKELRLQVKFRGEKRFKTLNIKLN